MPSKPRKANPEDIKWSKKIKDWLHAPLRTTRKYFEKYGTFEKLCDDIASQMSRTNTTRFMQKYAAGALGEIINGRPIISITVLDALFNTYAPALNASLLQTGYNSIAEMYHAATNGNINVANFLQGFSDGLSTMVKDEQIDDSKYGEEIPIDVVENVKLVYTTDIATKDIAEKKRYC